MHSYIQSFKIILLATLLAAGISYVYAWTGPTQTPPNGNVSAPINVGVIDQIKDAGLGVNMLAVFGQGSFGGEVIIGSTGAACDINLEGGVRYDSGTQCLQLCSNNAWSNIQCPEQCASVANGTTGSYPGCTVTCNTGYVLQNGSCEPGQCASVANGTTGSYPGCTVTCNAGYTLQNGSCELTSVYAWGCGGSFGDNSAPCDSQYTWGCNSSSWTSCGGNAYLFCPDGYHWTWTCGTEYSNGTRGQNVDESNCGGRHYSPWTCNP